jgi:transcriptional regulator with XRE-family HTH domain
VRYVENMKRSQTRTTRVLGIDAAGLGSKRQDARATRRARPALKPDEYRGGEWGYGVAERLWGLKGELGVRRFADRVGLSASLVSSYLNGRRLPDAPTLRLVAERTGVSLDWLLLGEGGMSPVYRGQVRSEASLEQDVAAYVTRALCTSEGVADSLMSPDEIQVDGRAVLADAANREVEAFRQLYDAVQDLLALQTLAGEAARNAGARAGTLGDVMDMLERTRWPVPTVPIPKDKRDLAALFGRLEAQLTERATSLRSHVVPTARAQVR